MKAKTSDRPILTVLAIWFFVFLTLFVMSGCPQQSYPECKFSQGEMVRSKISSQIGQVTRNYSYRGNSICRYDVRFAASQSKTNTRLLGPDGAIAESPLALVKYMKEFELEKVE